MQYFQTRRYETGVHLVALMSYGKEVVIFDAWLTKDEETIKSNMIIAATRFTKQGCFIINSCAFDSKGNKI